MIDLIGDIHGHANKLELLLQKMGYTKTGRTYRHPCRKVLFVGDYIDRGPEIRETLEIVKAMVDSAGSIALIGNHEYNAICFNLELCMGAHLRKHEIKNVIQHYETSKQFQNKQNEYNVYIEWFKTLPFYYETEIFRAAHACWDNKNIAILKKSLENDGLTNETAKLSVNGNLDFQDANKQTLKGKEAKLPIGDFFDDKDGNSRTHIRIKWWENPVENSYKSISVLDNASLSEKAVNIGSLKSSDYYKSDEKIVFFGHYWLQGEPILQRKNICCLDYSVAKGGKLVAYRHDGESTLDSSKFVFV